MSIRLHKKHGVNPTLLVCFACGEETGEIALLGAKGKAPMRMVMNYNPCAKCRAKMKNGYVLVIEATESPVSANQVPFQPGAYPTGKTLFASDTFFEANKEIFGEGMVSQTLEARCVLMEKEVFQSIVEAGKEVSSDKD